MIKTISVDDQNYDVIVEHARKAIRKYAPYWTDENAHDPGITMIELFAWLKEMLQFYMDQTTDSIEYQFLKLLGITADYGKPAHMIIQCLNPDTDFILPYKTKLVNGRYTFETQETLHLESARIIDLFVNGSDESKSVFQSVYNGLSIYPFGPECLPGSHFTIHYDRPLSSGKLHQLYIQIFDTYDIKRNPFNASQAFIPLSNLRWQASENGLDWVDLELLSDETYGFLQSGMVGLQLPNVQPEGGVRQIRVELVSGNYDVSPRIVDVFNRVIEIAQTDSPCFYTESFTQVEGTPYYFDGTGLPDQRLGMPHADVFFESLGVEVLEKQPNGQSVWTRWQLVEQLQQSGESESCFTVMPFEQKISFGNGVHGKIPPKGSQNIRIAQLERSYFDEGNLQLDYLTDQSSSLKWRCLTTAAGGRKRPSLDMLKKIMTESMSKQSVCVTAADYEQVILETPGLMLTKAKCLPLFSPELRDYPNVLADNSVSLLVIPYGEQRINRLNPAYLANLKRQAEAHRLISTEVHILDPLYFEIQVYCEISTPYAEPEALLEAQQIIQNLNCFDFGESVSKSIFYKALSESTLISRIHNISLRCDRPLSKNRLGDLMIPVNGLGIISEIEVIILQD